MTTTTRRPISAGARLAACVLFGLALGIGVALSIDVAVGVLLGIGALHLAFVVSGWLVLWPMDAETTRAHTAREDLPIAVEEGLVVLSSVGALIAIGVMLVVSSSAQGRPLALLALITVFLAWASLHLMYAARYGDLFYGRAEGGIDFNNHQPPAYRDFLYFSYNLGMAYQVSDTSVSSSLIRAVVLRHCLLSYLFGAVVLAGTINLVASIVQG